MGHLNQEVQLLLSVLVILGFQLLLSHQVLLYPLVLPALQSCQADLAILLGHLYQAHHVCQLHQAFPEILFVQLGPVVLSPQQDLLALEPLVVHLNHLCPDHLLKIITRIRALLKKL